VNRGECGSGLGGRRSSWRSAGWLALAGCALLATSCERTGAAGAQRHAPSAELTKRAVMELLPGLQFGPDPAAHTYREIRAAEVAGSHFVPATDRWNVHYCVAYTSFASDAPARRCDLSVDVYRLDSGKWIGFARGVGTLYRWRVLEEKPAEKAGESDGAGGSKSES
jgi:hypothetical protein